MKDERRARPRLDAKIEAAKTRETLARAAVFTTNLVVVAELWKQAVAAEHDEGGPDE